jgi:diguanylate cyclase
MDIAFAAVAAGLGAGAGWWFRCPTAERGVPEEQEPDGTETQEENEKPQNSREHDLQRIAAQLHQVTASVAADVDAHNTRVQEINDGLSSSDDQEVHILTAVEQLVRANEEMRTQLSSAEQRLQVQASEIETHVQQARTDALTKLANRRAFDDEMAHCVARLDADNQPSCLMLLDIDHFKHFNDTYGHQAGDEILRGVAKALLASVTGTEIVCRYGGEEFAVILQGCDINNARATAEKARRAIGDTVFEYEGMDLRVTASAGLAQLQHEETASQVIQRSDEALYTAKREGRDRGYWHDGVTTHPLTARSAAQEQASSKASDEREATQANWESTRESHWEAAPGLSRREVFVADVDRRIAESKRSGTPLSVLLVAIDNFASLCDEYGEKASEVAEKATAQVLRACMRDMDHLSQFEDEVFAVLLPGSCLTGTGHAAERIRQAIERCRLPLHGHPLEYHVSIGFAEAEANDDSEELVSRAEASLAEARNSGGNCCLSASKNRGCHAVGSATAS